MAERQRRKTARESHQQPVKSSLVNGVARRASLLWSGRKSQHDSRPSRNDRGLGNHAALQSRDSVDVVPLGSLGTAGVDTPNTSPLPIQHDVNPFSHPSDSISFFVDQPAVMDVSSNSPTFSTQIDDDTKQLAAKRRSLVQSPSRKPPPTPKPLHLPSPCTQPPPNGQLQPTPSPSISPPPNDGEGEPRSTRWWHDWLCGCSEGDDRGGDDQVSIRPFFPSGSINLIFLLGWQDKSNGMNQLPFIIYICVQIVLITLIQLSVKQDLSIHSLFWNGY